MRDECGNCSDTPLAGCFALSPDRKYVCTRELEHRGIHVACGIDSHHLCEWKGDKDETNSSRIE